jgi:hypothetical protein
MEDWEDELVRAQDILLGTHGFGEEARLLELKVSDRGYSGRGMFQNGDHFEFSSDEELDELECWAVEILVANSKKER